MSDPARTGVIDPDAQERAAAVALVAEVLTGERARRLLEVAVELCDEEIAAQRSQIPALVLGSSGIQ